MSQFNDADLFGEEPKPQTKVVEVIEDGEFLSVKMNPVEDCKMVYEPKPKQQLATISAPEPSPMGLIHAALERGMGPDELGKFMDLQERHEKRQAYKAFAAAMAAFQAECPNVFKSKAGANSNYAPLEEIWATIKPLLYKNGLSVRFDSKLLDASVLTICKVTHIGGYFEESTVEMPIEHSLSKAGNRLMNDAQAGATAIAYGKRYALKNAFNIVESDEDRDGAGTEEVIPLITDKQCITLGDYAEAGTIDKTKFLAYISTKTKAKYTEFNQLPAALWPQVEKMIDAKLKAKENHNAQE